MESAIAKNYLYGKQGLTKKPADIIRYVFGVHPVYIDQFVVPPIFHYLIGAKDVEIRLVCTFNWHDRRMKLRGLVTGRCEKTSTFSSGLNPKNLVVFMHGIAC